MVCVQECSPIVERGIVIQVLDKAFDVLVQRYGVIKRVYCEVLWYIYMYIRVLRAEFEAFGV